MIFPPPCPIEFPSNPTPPLPNSRPASISSPSHPCKTIILAETSSSFRRRGDKERRDGPKVAKQVTISDQHGDANDVPIKETRPLGKPLATPPHRPSGNNADNRTKAWVSSNSVERKQQTTRHMPPQAALTHQEELRNSAAAAAGSKAKGMGKASAYGGAVMQRALPHDLPSFPVIGVSNPDESADTAANLATHVKSPEVWRPDPSAAAGAAASLAKANTKSPEIWHPPAKSSSAASAAAVMAKATPPARWTAPDQPNSLKAAKLSTASAATSLKHSRELQNSDGDARTPQGNPERILAVAREKATTSLGHAPGSLQKAQGPPSSDVLRAATLSMQTVKGDKLSADAANTALYSKARGADSGTAGSGANMQAAARRSNAQGGTSGSLADAAADISLRKEMAYLNAKMQEVDSAKVERDRVALLAAAQRITDAKIAAMDKSNAARGIPRREDWNAAANDIAQKHFLERLAVRGKVDLGGGKFMSHEEIDEIARLHVQPVLDEISNEAERKIAHDEEMRILKAAEEKRIAEENEELRKQKEEERRVKAEEKSEQRRQDDEWRERERKERETIKAAERERKEEERKEREKEKEVMRQRKEKEREEREREKAAEREKKEAERREREEHEAERRRERLAQEEERRKQRQAEEEERQQQRQAEEEERRQQRQAEEEERRQQRQTEEEEKRRERAVRGEEEPPLVQPSTSTVMDVGEDESKLGVTSWLRGVLRRDKGGEKKIVASPGRRSFEESSARDVAMANAPESSTSPIPSEESKHELKSGAESQRSLEDADISEPPGAPVVGEGATEAVENPFEKEGETGNPTIAEPAEEFKDEAGAADDLVGEDKNASVNYLDGTKDPVKVAKPTEVFKEDEAAEPSEDVNETEAAAGQSTTEPTEDAAATEHELVAVVKGTEPSEDAPAATEQELVAGVKGKGKERATEEVEESTRVPSNESTGTPRETRFHEEL